MDASLRAAMGVAAALLRSGERAEPTVAPLAHMLDGHRPDEHRPADGHGQEVLLAMSAKNRSGTDTSWPHLPGRARAGGLGCGAALSRWSTKIACVGPLPHQREAANAPLLCTASVSFWLMLLTQGRRS